MSADLLPCPFCGKDVDGVTDANEGVGHTVWYVVFCNQCEFNTFGDPDMDKAIAQWNQRAPAAGEDVADD